MRNLLLTLTLMGFAAPAWAIELMMVEQHGCEWCERWDEEISHIYPKTAEGKFAPLRRENIRRLPADIELDNSPVFTPTFIILDEGRELGRIEGYPGEDFFWPLLERLLRDKTGFVGS
ncbi:MAG: hypothetical protein AAFU82_08655 [Pseudomonadota bacterium]